ncbi:MAG: SIS domain-containing protein [Thermoplasmatota archaeon]
MAVAAPQGLPNTSLDGELGGADGGAFLGAIAAKEGMFRAGYETGRRLAPKGIHPVGLLFCGMGGSGATAALVKDACTRVLDLPFTIVRHYQFPNHVKANWQVLALSYSGETEETLTVTRTALERGCPVTTFTSGGRLSKMGALHIPQPSGYAPRQALAHAWASMLGYLQGTGLLAEPVPAEAAAKAIRDVDASCGPRVPEERNEAKQLARRLVKAIPHIYVTPAFHGAGMFFRSLLNENAKMIANVDMVPECNHNDFTAWGGDPHRSLFTVLMLSHASQNPEIQKRIQFMARRYQAWGVPWHHHLFGPVDSFAEHVVEQAKAIQILDYTSYYAALLRGVDPNAIPEVRGLKAFLRGA